MYLHAVTNILMKMNSTCMAMTGTGSVHAVVMTVTRTMALGLSTWAAATAVSPLGVMTMMRSGTTKRVVLTLCRTSSVVCHLLNAPVIGP